MSDFLVTSNEEQQKRLIYLKIIYLIGILMSGIYLLRFNFEYQTRAFNDLLIPLWVLLVSAPPLCLYRFKSYLAATLITLAALTCTLIYLLYVSGGLDAPGIFWLATIPLVYAILLNIPGAVVGYLVVFATMSCFWHLKSQSLGPNVVAAYGDYAKEKAFNVITFLFFTAISTHVFIRGEKRFARSLEEKALGVENLLRVLLHDIANTLSSMTYQLIRVKEEGEHNGFQEIEKIERAVEDISNLLTQVRLLKSVKDGKASLPSRATHLALILEDVYASSEPIATQKGIKLCMDLPREKVLVNAEKTILGNIVIRNILTNSVKFSNPGDRIELRAFLQNDHAVIEIQDYGVGIPQEILDNIFKLNTKTSRPGTQGEKGTGYGMPLVREYLEMMNGSIEIHSAEMPFKDRPRGTMVRVRLPVAK